MANSPLDLSSKRAEILQRMAAIQSMELGSLKAEYRTSPSGEKSGPYFKHQVWTDGANLSQRVPAEDAPKLQAAIENRQHFEQLSADFIAATVEQTRQAHSPLEHKKKTLATPLLAQEAELDELMVRFAASAPSGQLLQQLEPLIRSAVFKPANTVVGLLLQQAVDAIDAKYQPKPGYVFKGRAVLQVQCLFGDQEICRDYYYNADRKEGYCPADSTLGLENGYTPCLSRILCREGASARCFLEASKNLAETGGVKVSGRQIQRMIQKIGPSAQDWQKREASPGHSNAEVLYVSADGTGIPALPSQTEGRQGKAEDGKAKTRQVYLGCVFTQHQRDDEGRPVRDPDSTTYVSSMESIHEFGPQLRQEALRRGLATVAQTVLLIDGALGLQNMGLSCFPKAIQIVDFFHAMEHAGEVLAALHGPQPPESPEHKKRLRHWAKQLLKNRVKALVTDARCSAAGTAAQPIVEKALSYFESNIDRMQYKTFRDKGFFIGSGVVEAGCKAVIGARCKQSGMRWSVRGAENVLAFRCIQSSGRLDEFWKHHLNLRAAEIEPLHLAA